MNEYDIAIIGGGLVGASLAVALAESPLRVVLIEAAAPPASSPSWDERCIALNDASQRIFSGYGVWEAMQGDAAPIVATHISERGRFGTARFSAAETGLPALGYNRALRALGAALSARMAAAAESEPAATGIRLCALAVGADAVELSVESGGATRIISARLVAAADGARSAVRDLLGIAAERRDYAQHAIVSAVRLSRPHQGVAYERFTPDGPIAVIPKPDDAASLVWTLPDEQVEARLALSDAEYLALAQDCFGAGGAASPSWAGAGRILARVLSGRSLRRRARYLSATPHRHCIRWRRRASISACAMWLRCSPGSPVL